MIKLAIVGTGGMANAHATAFKNIKDVEIVAVCDVIEERVLNFAKEYNIDKEFFLATVNNVLTNDALKILQDFYKNTISENVYLLGDKQSKRYKAHNEPMSRFLHYEILPLIERLTIFATSLISFSVRGKNSCNGGSNNLTVTGNPLMILKISMKSFL